MRSQRSALHGLPLWFTVQQSVFWWLVVDWPWLPAGWECQTGALISLQIVDLVLSWPEGNKSIMSPVCWLSSLQQQQHQTTATVSLDSKFRLMEGRLAKFVINSSDLQGLHILRTPEQSWTPPWPTHFSHTLSLRTETSSVSSGSPFIYGLFDFSAPHTVLFGRQRVSLCCLGATKLHQRRRNFSSARL